LRHDHREARALLMQMWAQGCVARCGLAANENDPTPANG
jgi:hypothetical protein